MKETWVVLVTLWCFTGGTVIGRGSTTAQVQDWVIASAIVTLVAALISFGVWLGRRQ